MKKAIILAVFAMTVFVANAQKGFHAGIKFIPQTVWTINKALSDDPGFRYANRFRFGFGATFNYHFTDKAGVGLDLIYSPQGQAYNPCEGCEEEYLLELNYFKLPILLHWNGDPDKVAMFMGEFGPQFSFLTKAEDEGLAIFLGNGDVESEFKKVNIGLVLGLGVGFNITDYLVASVKLRFDAGLTDAAEDNSIYSIDLNDGEHKRTWVLAGGMPEIGIKYVLRTK